MKCGLLGRKLGHSYSPQIHAHLGDYSYRLFEKEPHEIGDFLKNGDFVGLNVTIPYKKDVLPYCHRLSKTALEMGAVNTIVRQADGTLVGHNTDYFGFEQMLIKTGIAIRGKKALVLGSGGASNTAVAVLNDYGAQTVIISRNGENNYNNLFLHKDTSLIVNATPVGMFPNNGATPVDVRDFPKLECVMDMIYNPARTKLLQEAQETGIPTINGLLMLIAQAKESAEWFLDAKLPYRIIEQVHHQLCHQMENIILIGMPGSGKTTIGTQLSSITGKPFVDADAYLEETYGRRITDILTQDGESVFRQMETQVLSELGKQSGIILATGGGCVTREENYSLLHQNGKIFFIQRDLQHLATDGRPLSQTTSLQAMYAVRKPLYEKFADYWVENKESPEATAQQIQRLWEESI